MYRLKDDQFPETVPTVGLNMESCSMSGYELTIWDVGGKARNMWKHYFEDNSAVCFVIDSTDVGRLVIAKMELKSLLGEEALRSVPFLVLLNKSDVESEERIS